MKKGIKNLVCLLVCHLCLFTGISEANPEKVLPKNHVADYVIKHLDLSTISSSVGPRREDGKKTFADYGFKPTKLSENEALLKWKEGWAMQITVLKHSSHTIEIGLSDWAENGGNYKNYQRLVLNEDSNSGMLVGPYKSGSFGRNNF